MAGDPLHRELLAFEFSLNIFTEFCEFSDKNVYKLKDYSSLQHLVAETSMILYSQQDTYSRHDPKIVPNSCFSDFFLNVFTAFIN